MRLWQVPMKIVTLIENTALPGLAAEHGLSLYIETGDCRILFDMGQSEAFAQNADTLGIDLGKVDFAVISHGHYDHGGGLEAFFRRNDHAPVYVSRYALEAHYNRTGKDIGLNPALRDNPRLCFDTIEGRPGIDLCCIPLPPEDNDGMFLLDRQPEDFRHEQYLRIREGDKTVLFSGCSHKGITQIVQTFTPDVLVGGFHLMRQEDAKVLRRIARELLGSPTRYATGHCTGAKQFEIMKAVMADRLDYWPAGTVAQI